MMIELSKAETLVLHDLLYRIRGEKEIFEDISEQYVLWIIEAQLEKELVEPSMENYSEIIKRAKGYCEKRILEGDTEWD